MYRRLCTLLAFVVLLAVPAVATATEGTVTGPIRAATYYPWFPEAWSQQAFDPFSIYTPTVGYYDSGDPTVQKQQIAAMQYGGLNSAVLNWWGPDRTTDGRVPGLLASAADTGFDLALNYEREGGGDPTEAQIRSDLDYARRYASDDRYLKVATPGGTLPVLFVYGPESCAGVARWLRASEGWAVILKVFPGYGACDAQPYGWHQSASAARISHQAGFSFSVSPGFWMMGEPLPRLPRDLPAFTDALQQMVASGEPVQLVTSFNEWGEGSAVESALEWGTPSGYGAYLDAMHAVLGGTEPPPPPPPPPKPKPGAFTVAAAGDISCASASCPGSTDTSDLILAAAPDAVLPLGDLQYEDGQLTNFKRFYDSSWGRLNDRLHPTLGNHEYGTRNAQGYNDYMTGKGIAIGASNGYAYSWDGGGVHFVALNSECSHISACGPENTWLAADLAAHPAACTVAYWHEPIYTSGRHGDATQMQAIWNTLYDNGADIVLSGHNHDYEAYDELGRVPGPVRAGQRGIREFVVGTGGKNHYALSGGLIPGERVQNDNSFGALFLTFRSDGTYGWSFKPVPGGAFTDSGVGSCH